VGLISAPYQPGDEEGINALYRRLTGRTRGPRRFAWEWLQQPTGEPCIWVIRDDDTGEIVGQHCLMPLELSWFGQRVLIGKTENTMMHPRYRGTGAYFPFERRFIERDLDDRFAMLMTTWAGGAPGRIRAKLGYCRLGRWAELLRFADRTQARRTLGAAVDKAFGGRTRALARRGLPLATPVIAGLSRRRRAVGSRPDLSIHSHLDGVSDELDAFWDRNRAHYGITIWRSSRYLRWRLFDNPWVEVELWLARRGPELMGYAVIQRLDDGAVRLIDVLVEGNDPARLTTLLATLSDALLVQGTTLIRAGVLGPSQHLEGSLVRAGFLRLELPRVVRRPRPRIRWRTGAPVMLQVRDTALDRDTAMDPRNWYFTVLFTEGIS